MLDDINKLDKLEKDLEAAVAELKGDDAERANVDPVATADDGAAITDTAAETAEAVEGTDTPDDAVATELPGPAKTPARARKKKKNAKKKKQPLDSEPGTSRGVETLFRTTYDVQMGLTSLADTKANMMISVNGIIISVIIAAAGPRLEAYPQFLIPAGIFLIGTLVAIVFAILAAQPRLWRGRLDTDTTPGSENILFFGDFSRRSEQEFVDRMMTLMGDRRGIYESMTRNIYGLGSVLRRKFHLLNIAYTSFMLALIFGVAASIMAVVLTL